MSGAVECCGGCGVEAPAYPQQGCFAVGAVVRNESGDGWKVMPVCDRCYYEPTSRRFPIKGHFFARGYAEEHAVQVAGRDHIGGER